jgi:hypothetical protein
MTVALNQLLTSSAGSSSLQKEKKLHVTISAAREFIHLYFFYIFVLSR